MIPRMHIYTCWGFCMYNIKKNLENDLTLTICRSWSWDEVRHNPRKPHLHLLGYYMCKTKRVLGLTRADIEPSLREFMPGFKQISWDTYLLYYCQLHHTGLEARFCSLNKTSEIHHLGYFWVLSRWQETSSWRLKQNITGIENGKWCRTTHFIHNYYLQQQEWYVYVEF